MGNPLYCCCFTDYSRRFAHQPLLIPSRDLQPRNLRPPHNPPPQHRPHLLLVHGPAPFNFGLYGAPIATGISYLASFLLLVAYSTFIRGKRDGAETTSSQGNNLKGPPLGADVDDS